MRTIGHRKERPITFSASATVLLEGARFNDEIHRLPTGRSTFIPKGVFHFKSHEAANQHQQACLIEGMAQIALKTPLMQQYQPPCVAGRPQDSGQFAEQEPRGLPADRRLFVVRTRLPSCHHGHRSSSSGTREAGE